MQKDRREPVTRYEGSPYSDNSIVLGQFLSGLWITKNPGAGEAPGVEHVELVSSRALWR